MTPRGASKTSVVCEVKPYLETSGVSPLRIPRLHPSSVSGPGIGPPPDPFWARRWPDPRHDPGHGRAQRLGQEQPQVNHLAEQNAVLPSVRTEHALMNLRGSLFRPNHAPQ